MGLLLELALGYRGGADSASATKYTQQERLAVLEQITRLETGLSQAMSNNDKSALVYYEAQVRAQQENRKLTNQLVRDALRADGTMNVEALKARAADIRNIRDNTARLMSAYGRRGLSEYQNAVSQFAGQLGGANAPAGRAAVIEYMATTLDPSDPATYEALRTADSALGGLQGNARAEALRDQAKRAWDASQADLRTVGRFTENPPTSAAEAGELKAALENIGNSGTPSFEAARAAVGEGSAPDIKDRIAKLEGQLSSTAVSGLQPPTMAQLAGAAQRSGYRKWAEDRGFTLGTVGDNGQYEPGPDDQRAYWRAWREANGRMTFGRDKLGSEQSLVVMPTGEAERKAASNYRMVPFAGADGSLASALVETPVGDLYWLEGENSTLVRTRDGAWTSPQAKLDLEGNVASLQTWNLDGKPVTLETAAGVFDPANQTKLSPVGDAETPGSTLRVNGRKLNAHLTDDPNNTIRMAVPDANGVVYEVKYTRENADMPWSEQERVESKRYAGTLKPALPDGAPIPEPFRLANLKEQEAMAGKTEQQIRLEVARMGREAGNAGRVEEPLPPRDPNAVGTDAGAPTPSTRPGGAGAPPEKAQLQDMPGAPSAGAGAAIQRAAEPPAPVPQAQVPPATAESGMPLSGTPEAIAQGLAANPEGTQFMLKVAPMLRADEAGKPVVTGFGPETDAARQGLAIQQADAALALTMEARRKAEAEAALRAGGDKLALRSAAPGTTPNPEAPAPEAPAKVGFFKALAARFRRTAPAESKDMSK